MDPQHVCCSGFIVAGLNQGLAYGIDFGSSNSLFYGAVMMIMGFIVAAKEIKREIMDADGSTAER